MECLNELQKLNQWVRSKVPSELHYGVSEPNAKTEDKAIKLLQHVAKGKTTPLR
jgi:hypothetical protein